LKKKNDLSQTSMTRIINYLENIQTTITSKPSEVTENKVPRIK